MPYKTVVMKAGLAGALVLSATAFAVAQSAVDNNPWTHTRTAAANGQCWKLIDSTRGFGYWTACPESARATANPDLRQLRAQAPSHYGPGYYR